MRSQDGALHYRASRGKKEKKSDKFFYDRLKFREALPRATED